MFTKEEGWDVLEDIPADSAAALILLEHHWAIPLRDAIARAGGFRISDGYISPLDLIDIGLMSAEEAKELHDLESAASAQELGLGGAELLVGQGALLVQPVELVELVKHGRRGGGRRRGRPGRLLRLVLLRLVLLCC